MTGYVQLDLDTNTTPTAVNVIGRAEYWFGQAGVVQSVPGTPT